MKFRRPGFASGFRGRPSSISCGYTLAIRCSAARDEPPCTHASPLIDTIGAAVSSSVRSTCHPSEAPGAYQLIRTLSTLSANAAPPG